MDFVETAQDYKKLGSLLRVYKSQLDHLWCVQKEILKILDRVRPEDTSDAWDLLHAHDYEEALHEIK